MPHFINANKCKIYLTEFEDSNTHLYAPEFYNVRRGTYNIGLRDNKRSPFERLMEIVDQYKL